ncbi:MAG TPA: DUF488 family protein [Burkholderiales bacterium]
MRRRRTIAVKRVCEAPSRSDGLRVLVDRLWPRGLSRRAVAADLWLREAAPSPALRRWYAHEPRRWKAFAARYRAELERRPEVIRMLRDLRRRAPLTLLCAARDAERSNAAVLRELLETRRRKRR